MRRQKSKNKEKFSQSKLWEKLEGDLFNDVGLINLDSFRSPGKLNNRLASWDPYDKRSIRYFKNILYNLVDSMDDTFYEYYKKIGMTNLGKPIYITYKGIKFNLDYIFSVQEIIFCKNILNEVNSVVEIGAGFGRTCHAILNNFSNIKSYTIIDIPAVLGLSKKYLRQVLNNDIFQKIRFIKNINVRIPPRGGGSIFINIDSMQEMDQKVAKDYLSLIDGNGNYFYSRNAICKYEPSVIGLIEYDKGEFDNAISVGLCQNIVDIFNSDELEKARKKYIEKYKPSDSWQLVKQEISSPWQYYHHVLYSKEK